MIKRRYKIRPSWKGKEGEGGKEITLHPDWCEYNKLESGDEITILANGVMVLLPPKISAEKEAEVRRFLEGENIGSNKSG